MEYKPYAEGQLIVISDHCYYIEGVYKEPGLCQVVGLNNVTRSDITIDGRIENVMYVPVDILFFALKNGAKRYEEIK